MGAGKDEGLSIVQSIINSLPGAVAYLSSDELVVRYASDDYRFFLPKVFRDRDVTGLKLEDIIYDTERDKILPLLRRASETREAVDIKDVQIGNEEGERYWVELHASPIENGTPKPDLLVTLQDVTGRRMAEEALQRSEQMLNIVIDNFPGVVYWKDRDSVYLGANKEAARIAGLTDPSEYMGKDDYDMPWSRTEAEAYRADDRQVMESGRPKLHVIESQRRADGSVGWLDTCKVPLYDSQGEVIGVLGTSMDITERKRAEEALRCDEARNRALFELAQSPGATSKDISGRAMEIGIELTKSKIGYITFMNEDETVLTVRNYSKSAMKECGVRVNPYVEDEPYVFPLATSGLWGEAVRQRRAIITNDYAAPNPLKKGIPEGHVPVTRHMSVPLFDRGKIVAVIGVGNKEAEYDDGDAQGLSLLMDGMWRLVRKIEAEERVRRSEEKYRTLFDHSLESIAYLEFVYDEHGNVIDAKFLDLNDLYIKRFPGKTKEEIIGKRSSECYEPDIYSIILPNLRRAKETNEPVSFEIRLGEKIYQACYYMMGKDHFVSAALDITDIKEAQRAIEEYSEELKRSNAELQQFAYVASHDLQEPMRMVTAYLSLLKDRYRDQLDERARMYIDTAVKGGLRSRELIRDLLDYSRVETNNEPLREIKMESVLNKVLNNLQEQIKDEGAIISHEPLPIVRADGSQMVQVMQNLIANAIKYHGTEQPRVHICTREDPKEWLFSVQDNGIGIDPRHADKIFVLFQRLHTSEEYSGTGIGLAISKKIVERHGGRIWFESEPGMGSTFYFTIPKGAVDEQTS